jgi:hypothetical protein
MLFQSLGVNRTPCGLLSKDLAEEGGSSTEGLQKYRVGPGRRIKIVQWRDVGSGGEFARVRRKKVQFDLGGPGDESEQVGLGGKEGAASTEPWLHTKGMAFNPKPPGQYVNQLSKSKVLGRSLTADLRKKI